MMENHLGQIVVARVLDRVKDQRYKLRAIVQTGDARGKECYVSHRGEPTTNEHIVIRLDWPPPHMPNLNLSDTPYTGFFVTSAIPDGFEYGLSEELVLYGIWEGRMRSGFAVPTLGSVKKIYDPGMAQRILHYSDRNRFIVPYSLLPHSRPEEIFHEESGMISGIESALRRYLKKMERFSRLPFPPRMVTIDEEIDFGRRILPVFMDMGLSYLRMEPQQ